MEARTSSAAYASPLGQYEAEQLDKQVQSAAEQVTGSLDVLFALLDKARTGQVHVALGYSGWTAYLADRLKLVSAVLGSDERRTLAAELFQAGMSVRAIAEAIGTSKSTVSRQLSQTGTGKFGDKVISLNGKMQKRRNHGGGHRGPLDAAMKLRRVGSTIAKISGLEGADAEKQREICNLIEELLASIQPMPEPD